MTDYKYLALEGGGAKGEAYIGMASALEKLGILKDIKAVSGASAGAITALVLATGWNVKRMKDILTELDFETLATGGFLGKLESPLTMIRENGLFDGDGFYHLFKKIIKEITGNENATFEDWHQLRKTRPDLNLKDISVQACNLNTRMNETFAYNTQHKDVPIADAVRASMGFPWYFTPWKIKGCEYADGGIQKNLPSDVFEKQPGVYNPKVLSVKLESFDQIKYFDKGVTPPPKPVDTPLQTTIAVVESMINAQDKLFQQSPYKHATIYCDTLDIGTLQFKMTQDEHKAIRASGEYGTIRYFYNLDPTLVEKHYDRETIEQLKAADFPLCFSEFLKKQQIPTEMQDKPTVVASSSSSHGEPSGKKWTPLFQKWSRNTALNAHCKHLHEIDASHRRLVATM
ncbi:patatin-like phospholipase family protein [Candidatus Berkiella aquae]|uniref:Patatin-like phospholipase n=1 Tax=Candidatus Berkiella aquae TaxID=295108 RepID=A0A0Q9YIF9_9GAMM|nr:patatin-like phospholipase family protein [Candidatus Berkiella aquae]MCS5712232.1 patatin-like phospholipase family protein [Candidatus Berkiella aquae]